MLGEHQVEDDLVARSNFLASLYRLIESATSAAVASAILLTNRTCLIASQQRPVIEAEEPAAGGRFEISQRRPDQRVAAAQVVVEKAQAARPA